MTAAAAPIGLDRSASLARWLAPTALLIALAGIVEARLWATRAGLDPLAVGAAFGLALAAVASVGVLRAARTWRLPSARSVLLGLGLGVALTAITIAASVISGQPSLPSDRPAAPFVPWAAIIIVVAVAEEALLRGRLFDAVRRVGGIGLALAVTTVAFALMHVPLYGWHVVPLDLAVGITLGGLRLATGGIAAPAAAHAIADLATWWL
ncbi:MAG TPA: CPBP family glutamic-type intramembrane protease [Candidatus Limnocylindrales bacterium]|jgi:membrane protease YdiL (CAAX protease family)